MSLTPATNLESLVKTIVTSLVDKPDEVQITSNQGAHSLVIEVQVAKDDIGKIIGREGKTAYAIRMLLNNAAGKQKTSAMLQIVEPNREKKSA